MGTARAVIKALQSHKKAQPQKGNKKALIVLTNTGVLGDGTPSGWYLPTVSYPYAGLEEEGIQITFCSPHGGNAQVDDESVGLWDHPENQAFMKDKQLWIRLKTPYLFEISIRQNTALFILVVVLELLMILLIMTY